MMDPGDEGEPDDRVSGIVLAGGQSRRLGRDKAVEPLGGQPMIRRVLERVAGLTSESIVVVADRARGDALPLLDDTRVIPDVYPGMGSLGGIFSGLAAVGNEWAVVTACDMPFLNGELLGYLASLREGMDVVAPVVEGRPEPTHALYSKKCLPFIEERLRAEELKITGFYDRVRVRYVEEEEIRKFDPDLLSFFNVNSPQDLERARALAADGR